jgi:hypothetical protein
MRSNTVSFVARLACASLLSALFYGCATSAPGTGNASSSGPDVYPATVAVRVESEPTSARVVVNGQFVGRAPRTIYLQVDEGGRLLFDCTIVSDQSGSNSSRVASMIGAATMTESAERVYEAGTVPPARIMFLGRLVQETGLATTIVRNVAPTIRRVDSGVGGGGGPAAAAVDAGE